MPKLSIVIPTHKRPETLRKCLDHIALQTALKDLEVVVVHDGEGAEDSAAVARSRWPMNVTYAEIPKSQQGVARNRGVELATGDTILFIGDDIFLHPEACEMHIDDHEEIATHDTPRPQLFLGHITWDPEIEITPVMKWLEESGWQFAYKEILQLSFKGAMPKDRQPFFTYTSHISLPRTLALKFPFRENITLYGWEDVEWGKRLADAGIDLDYNSDAKAFHHHHMTLEDSLKRMETIGKSAVLIERINKNLGVVPRGLKRLAYSVIALMPTMRGEHTRAFLRGMNMK